MKHYLLMMLVFAAIVSGYSQIETKIMASNGDEGDLLSNSVDIWDKYAIAGAPMDEPNGIQSGSVYFYEQVNGTWTEMQNIIPSDGIDYAEFGHSVTISGEWAAVGAWQHGPEQIRVDGKVYIYHRDANGVWSLSESFANDNYDRFGSSVSLDNGFLAVGASAATSNVNGTDVSCGSAFIYRYTGAIWEFQDQVGPSDGEHSDDFGNSICISGNQLVVGAWHEDLVSADDDNAGAAYVFSKIGSVWTEDAKLVPSDINANDNYGFSVAVKNDRVLVGSPWDDDNGSKSGSAYFYDYDGSVWGPTNKITAFDAVSSARFGIAVGFIDANNAIVGANNHKISGQRVGAAYLYEYDSNNSEWIANTIDNQITADAGVKKDNFGIAVAGDGDNVFIGGDAVDSGTDDWGASYFYDVSASILPVELVNFKAAVTTNQSVRLDWETTSETNNEGFEVQRSQDGLVWKNIGWIEGRGNSNELQNYTFVDKNPELKINYYRLNQIDFDGRNEVSKIVSAYLEFDFSFTVYPNPTPDYLHLRYDTEKNKIQSIILYDLKGRLVMIEKDSTKVLDMTHLPKGNYILTVKINDQFFSENILKN